MNANLSHAMPVPNNDVIDINLEATRKKRFRFNGDDNCIVEVNVSDMNILDRLNVAYPKLQEETERASKLMDGIEIDKNNLDTDTMNSTQIVANRLKEIDASMRELVDYIFNAPVSAAAAPDGSMYDPFSGSFRFEHIITVLLQQYENNMEAEFKKMAKQVDKHASKYTKGK